MIRLTTAGRPLLRASLRDDLDLGDAIWRDQTRYLDCRPGRERWLYIILLHSDDCRHLGCQIGVKARDVHDIIPARLGILQHLANSLEGSRVGDAEIGLAVPYSRDHPGKIN